MFPGWIVLFPRWEHYIPTVGLNSRLLRQNKMVLLSDKRLMMMNNSILSQNKETYLRKIEFAVLCPSYTSIACNTFVQRHCEMVYVY